MNKRALKWLQALLVAVAMVFVIGRLRHDWGGVKASPIRFSFRPGWIALAFGATWAMYAVLVEGWRRLLLGWIARRVRWLTAARIWILSSIAALIPGRIWALAGMALMSERAGIKGGAAMAAAVVMQVLAIGTGVGVAALAVGPELQSLRPEVSIGMIGLGVIVLASVLLLHHGGALRFIWKLAGRTDSPPAAPTWPRLIEAISANAISWIGYGIALWALARGILPGVDLSLRLAIGAFAVSYIVGYLAVFTPGGLGVRELLMVGLLTPALGGPAALALSVASRLMLTINQLGAAAPFLVFRESPIDAS